MTQEKKQEILQKLEDKGLCSIDANLILDKAIQYSSVKGEYVIERYAIELADLLLSTTVFNKKTGDKIKKCDIIATLYTNNKNAIKSAKEKFLSAIEFSDKKPQDIPLIYEIVR
jgi:predicted phage-related endonuclease